MCHTMSKFTHAPLRTFTLYPAYLAAIYNSYHQLTVYSISLQCHQFSIFTLSRGLPMPCPGSAVRVSRMEGTGRPGIFDDVAGLNEWCLRCLKSCTAPGARIVTRPPRAKLRPVFDLCESPVARCHRPAHRRAVPAGHLPCSIRHSRS